MTNAPPRRADRSPVGVPRHPLVRAAIGIAVSVVCLVLVTRGIDPARTLAVLAGADWTLVALAAALVLLDLGLRAWRWQRLLRPVRSIAYGRVLRHTAIGYLANNILPARLGEVTRSVTLGREEGMSASTTFGTVIVERILDTGAIAVLAVPVARVSFRTRGDLSLSR